MVELHPKRTCANIYAVFAVPYKVVAPSFRVELRLPKPLLAKVTFEHPKSSTLSNTESDFETIAIRFDGVQYLRIVNSLHLLTNPNEDLGSIEQLQLKNPDSISRGLSLSKTENRIGLSLELSDANVATVYSSSQKVSFLDFVSEMISFEIGFEEYLPIHLSIRESIR